MAQREIEEAMKGQEAQNLVSDEVNPLKEWLGVKGGRMTRSRTRSLVVTIHKETAIAEDDRGRVIGTAVAAGLDF